MSLNYAPQTVSAEEYQRIFDLERQSEYPCIDAFEQRMGFAVDRDRLEHAARILSCPFKAASPNWQHGRVLYAATMHYLDSRREIGPIRTVDVGTAKGFSALCVRWAVEDSGVAASSYSVDVLPPSAKVRRNTVSEVDGLKTLFEILSPFPESKAITFVDSTGVEFLSSVPKRIHVAFVDGKHLGSVVKREGDMIAQRQESGDVCIFDDVHIPDVGKAVGTLSDRYQFEYLTPLPKRAYAVGVRR